MARPAEERLILFDGYGNNWKRLREDKGLTVRDMANKTGISASTISSIETENRKPTIHHLNVYSGMFNVSIDYLTGRSKVASIEKQEVCAYTGLSEKALRNIKGFGMYYDINQIFEDYTFFKFMICTYENFKKLYKPTNKRKPKEGGVIGGQ